MKGENLVVVVMRAEGLSAAARTIEIGAAPAEQRLLEAICDAAHLRRQVFDFVKHERGALIEERSRLGDVDAPFGALRRRSCRAELLTRRRNAVDDDAEIAVAPELRLREQLVEPRKRQNARPARIGRQVERTLSIVIAEKRCLADRG
jgi:hypothetical protein